MLLIVVLIMVVALTVGLSLVSRTLINVKTSTDTENSQKAFSAAEAGIEQALQKGSTVSTFTPSNTNLNGATIQPISVTDVGNTTKMQLNNGGTIHQDEGIDLSLSSDGNYTGTVTVYWGSNTDPCKEAALEITTIQGGIANSQMTHNPFDPCSTRSSSLNGNHFPLAPKDTIGFPSYQYSAAILVKNGVLMHIVPVYADTQIGVIGTANLPVQGKIISSTGVSGGTQRKISLYQNNEQIPPEMFYTLFVPQ